MLKATTNESKLCKRQKTQQCRTPFVLYSLPSSFTGKIPLPHAQELCEKFSPAICEDFVHRQGPEMGVYLGYVDVKKRLEGFQSSLSTTYGIPEPPEPPDVVAEVMNRTEELQMGNDMLSTLNEERRRVADRILESARNDAPQNCFSIDAPGGPGKLISFHAWLIA